MAITPRNGDRWAGVAGHSTEDLNASPDSLVTGDIPPLLGVDLKAAAGQELALHTVVGFNANNEIVPASLASGAEVQAIGILMYEVNTTDGNVAGAHVYRGGCFNPEVLVFDASYDTVSKKEAAFEGAPSPTQIILRAPRELDLTPVIDA